MRFCRHCGYSERDVRFANLKDLTNFAWFQADANAQKLRSVVRSNESGYNDLVQYLKENPNDREAQNAKALWAEANQLCLKAKGRYEEISKLLDKVQSKYR